MIRRLFDVGRDCAGTAFLEFALVLPVLLLVVFGITQFGLIFYHYTLVTNATAAGMRQLSISRLDSTAYCDTENTIVNASGGLGGTPGSSGVCPTLNTGFTIAMKVNGTACASNSACQTALATAYAAATNPPEPASVTVQYSCSAENLIEAPEFVIHLGVCPLSSTMQAPVQ
jgi:Flp pilus assembly protein TadG